MENMPGSQKLSVVFKIKRSVVGTSLLALGTAFEMVSQVSPELKDEIAGWESGLVFSLGVWPYGPQVTMRKESDGIHYLGQEQLEPKLKIIFKNIDSALLPLTGQMGAHTAFLQHRAFVHGNLKQAMQVNRAMNIVQKYLMPGLILNMNFKRPPKYTMAQRLIKGRIWATLGMGLAANFRK